MIHIETPFGEILCGDYSGKSLTMHEIIKKKKQSSVCSFCKAKSEQEFEKQFKDKK